MTNSTEFVSSSTSEGDRLTSLSFAEQAPFFDYFKNILLVLDTLPLLHTTAEQNSKQNLIAIATWPIAETAFCDKGKVCHNIPLYTKHYGAIEPMNHILLT